jgi:hypothetical protein
MVLTASKPKVSIILISYNHAKYLRESIDTVLDQTFSDFELFLVDDASTDGSWKIIESYTDPRIRAFRSRTNTGAGGDSRKVMSEVAVGEYIAIHHSDDAWEPQKLEKQVAFLESRPEIGAVFTQVQVIGEDGEPFEDRSHVYYRRFDQPNRSRHEWLNYFFRHGNALCHPSVLLRKACLEDCGMYRYGLSLFADLDMWVRLCLKYEIHILPEKLVRFRVRAGDANSSTGGAEMLARRPFEYLQVLNQYRALSSVEELVRVFPETTQYMKSEGFDPGFALGMAALKLRDDKFAKLFGLTLLFEAINDPERAAKIRALYDFGHSEFIALTAQNDVFSHELVPTLLAQSQKFSEQEAVHARAVEALQAKLMQEEQSLQEIVNSRGWKLVIALRKFHSILLPPGSPQERLVRFLVGSLK